MGDVRYKAKLTRAQCRDIVLRAETTPPLHKAAIRWLGAASSEAFDPSGLSTDSQKGTLSMSDDPAWNGEAEVEIEFTREAVLGMKYAYIQEFLGSKDRPPASLLRRRQIAKLLDQVDPSGALGRLVEKDGCPPEADDPKVSRLSLEEDAKKVDLDGGKK